MKKINFLCLILLLFGSCTEQKSVKEIPKKNILKKEGVNSPIGGTYTFGENIEVESVGSLKVYPISEKSALFYLDVISNSLRSGQLFGIMNINENIGVYESDDKSCVLKFKFNGREVKLLSGNTDSYCGFGMGVVVENTYKLKDQAIPEYFIDGNGDTVIFKGLTVEKYNQQDY